MIMLAFIFGGVIGSMVIAVFSGQAYEKGYEDGFAEGHSEAYENVKYYEGLKGIEWN